MTPPTRADLLALLAVSLAVGAMVGVTVLLLVPGVRTVAALGALADVLAAVLLLGEGWDRQR